MNETAHPQGFYGKWPEVTWDLAEDRWLDSRSGLLLAACRSCDWIDLIGPILMKPERIREAAWVAAASHSYQCPGDPQVEFEWSGPVKEMQLITAFKERDLEDVYQTLRGNYRGKVQRNPNGATPPSPLSGGSSLLG
jgi:hypothetical protein